MILRTIDIDDIDDQWLRENDNHHNDNSPSLHLMQHAMSPHNTLTTDQDQGRNCLSFPL